MTRTDVINVLFGKNEHFTSYLQIGVGDPPDATFINILAYQKQGITTMRMQAWNGGFYDPGSIDFWAACPLEQKYDVIFIQSIYEFDQVYADVHHAMEHLNEDGFIVIHGCNPLEKEWTIPLLQYSQGPWIGAAYRAFIRLKYEHKDWSFFVVDEDFGCGIITKRPVVKNKCMRLSSLDWETFEKFRKELLNLVTFEEYICLL